MEAREMGATEVCVQAGLPPGIDGWFYVEMVKALHAAAPEMHLHGCSPEDVLYGAGLAGVPVEEYLAALKDAGLGSLPLQTILVAVVVASPVRAATFSVLGASILDWTPAVSIAVAVGLALVVLLPLAHPRVREAIRGVASEAVAPPG